MHNNIDPFLTLILSSILVVAAITDLRTQKIPNLITFSAMFLGLVFYSITNGWNGLLFSFEGLLLGIGLLIIPYLMGGMGAGDAKLMGAIGAMIGPKGVFIAFLYTAIAGGVYALILLMFNMEYFKDFMKRSSITIKSFAFTRQFISVPAEESQKKPKLCYGVAIAVGTFSYVLLGYYGYNPV